MRRRFEPDSPYAWLSYAESDLTIAKIEKPGEIYLELLCFHCQQCAEKALKALLISLKIDPPRSHSIGFLLSLIAETIEIPADVREAEILSPYGTMARYPGSVEDEITEEKYHQAVLLAENCLSWAKEVIH